MDEGTKRDLFGRLARLSPLPADDAVTQEQLDEFGSVFDRFDLAPPDPDVVRPLLAAFGPGDGFGLYVHGTHSLLRQDRATVVTAALDALESGPEGPRRWAMETLRRMRERDRGDPPPSAREGQLVEAALRGPEPLAVAAVYWAYWVGGEMGRRLLQRAAQVAPGEARDRAVELAGE